MAAVAYVVVFIGLVSPARIAQSVEHILGKDEVTGSIPVACFESPAPVRGRAFVRWWANPAVDHAVPMANGGKRCWLQICLACLIRH